MHMQTRSQTRKQAEQQFEVDIDFNEASEAWNANKLRVGQMYIYICGALTKSGERCKRKPMKTSDSCLIHQK